MGRLRMRLRLKMPNRGSRFSFPDVIRKSCNRLGQAVWQEWGRLRRRPLVLPATLFLGLLWGLQVFGFHGKENSLPAVSHSVRLPARVEQKEYAEGSYKILFSTKEGRVYGIWSENPPDLRIGDTRILSGEWRSYQAATNPGQFDSYAYYKRLGIAGYLTEPELLPVVGEVPKRSLWDRVRERLFAGQQWASTILSQIAPKREAGVLKTMLLGIRREVDPSLRKLYQGAGIAHILAISGLHIALLGDFLYKLLCRIGFPRGVATGIAIPMMILYGTMTGMGTSVLRALLMFSLRLIAKLCKRTYDLLTATGIAAVCILVGNPQYLFDTGFLFSFSAVFGLAILTPAFREAFPCEHRIAERIRNAIGSSVSVTVMTLPVLLFCYYEVPLYSFALNLVILPLMTPLVISAVIGMLLHSSLLILPAVGILRFYEGICSVMSRIPGGTLITGCPKPVWILGYLLGVLLAARGMQFWKTIPRKRVSAICLLGIVICFLRQDPTPKEEVWFLDVGQGDCICIFDARGAVSVMDCGSTSKSEVGENILLPFLKYCGVCQVERVFLSHMDADHVNGIMTLLSPDSGIEVNGVFISTLAAKEHAEDSEILELCASRKIPVTVLAAGDYDRTMEVLYPFEEPEDTEEGGPITNSKNAESLVLRYSIGEWKLILTGDIDAEAEKTIIDQYGHSWDDKTILKVAHHGSRYSTSTTWLQWLQPSVAVISVGRNTYGHPHPDTLGRLEQSGCRIYTTLESGAVRVNRSGQVDSRRK